MSATRTGRATRVTRALSTIASASIAAGVGNGAAGRGSRRLSLPGLVCLCALICALPVVAQQAGSEVGPPGVADAQEAAGEPWAIMCRALAPGRTACGLVHRQVLESGGVLLALELAGLEAGLTPVLTMSAPLGTRLRDGIALSVDGRSLGVAAFTVCVQGGCLAQVSGEEMVARLQAGEVLEMRFVLDNGSDAGQAIALSVPLSGVTRAVETVRKPG
jgi:invasion protein IalB